MFIGSSESMNVLVSKLTNVPQRSAPAPSEWLHTEPRDKQIGN